MKKGIYETYYGNAAYVSGPSAKKAWDLDMGEWIPLNQIDPKKLIRAAKPTDTPAYQKHNW